MHTCTVYEYSDGETIVNVDSSIQNYSKKKERKKKVPVVKNIHEWYEYKKVKVEREIRVRTLMSVCVCS